MCVPVPVVTTWALVAISPEPEMTKPDPSPEDPVPSEITVTTPGDSRW